MEIIIKRFDELTVYELYEIMKLRVDVFIVEQNCPYADLDGVDLTALHVFLKDDDGIEAYLRIIPNKITGECVWIGRVIARKRRCGIGTQVLDAGIEAAKKYFHTNEIRINAQVYARKFYERVGFVQTTDEFLEDDIPHIGMTLKL
ncbi:MAG: GNAT family N-acetyltransferase [Synergistaceae bacterium]|nr:GNAT family N-acetyltransferase [Synergistaceae bacterium]